MLKEKAPIDKKELLNVVERLERLGISAVKDRDLERATYLR